MNATLESTTEARFDNIYMEKYTGFLRDAVANSEELNLQLQAAKVESGWRGGGGLAGQLFQVARIISTREERRIERDVFYVSLGGWDMPHDLHDRLEDSLP